MSNSEMTTDERINALSTLSALPPAELTGQFDDEDFSLPRWKVSRDTGNFVNTVTGEEKQVLDAVVIMADKSRFLWPEKFNTDNQPLCYSINGVNPYDTNTKFGRRDQAGNKWCRGCPMSEWLTNSSDERVPPRCAVSYNYLVLDLDSGFVSVLNLGRARTKTAKALNALWRTTGVKAHVRLYTETERHPSGTFWQVRFNLVDVLADWREFAKMMIENRSLQLTSIISAQEDLLPETGYIDSDGVVHNEPDSPNVDF
jgi:hypothetical protein